MYNFRDNNQGIISRASGLDMVRGEEGGFSSLRVRKIAQVKCVLDAENQRISQPVLRLISPPKNRK